MNVRSYLFLFLLGIIVLLPLLFIQSAPGYMDADYYFSGGLRLAEGKGFSELVLWNYLDDPEGLPHPSHGYWMPLTSLVAWMGMLVTNDITFKSARIGFILVAILIPPATASLAYSFTRNKGQSILSGFLAAFPVFYLSYLGTTETFGLYMFLGALWFLVFSRIT